MPKKVTPKMVRKALYLDAVSERNLKDAVYQATISGSHVTESEITRRAINLYLEIDITPIERFAKANDVTVGTVINQLARKLIPSKYYEEVE